MVGIFPKTKWGWLRFAVPAAVLLGVVGCLFVAPAVRYASYDPAEGDIVFQSLPHMELVDMIEGSTGSPYSHCGVVVRENDEWLVVESIGDVHKTPLSEWVRRGRGGGRFAAYRFKPEYREHIPRFVAELKPYMGRNYDFRYELDPERIYCSELCYKAWQNATGQQLGRLVRLGDLNWKPYQELMEKLEGGPVPLDREIITPKDLAKAEQLEKVYGGDF